MVWIAFWWPVIGAGEQLYIRDLSLFATPMKTYMLERLLAGEVPLWTPFVAAGMPFLADPSNQVFYPLNVVFLLTPSVAKGVSYFVMLHALLGMLAFFALCRAAGVSRAAATWGALLYGLSGYVLSIGDNVNYLPAVVWAPAGLAAYLRGLDHRSHVFSGLAAACLALLFLAGDALDAGVMVVAFGLLSLLHKRSRETQSPPGGRPSLGFSAVHLVLTIAVAAMITAVQVLPTLELIEHSTRRGGIDYEELSRWSFPPARLLEIVQPYFFGTSYPTLDFLAPWLYPTMREPWAGSVYHGIIPVILAVAGIAAGPRRALPWLLLFAVCLFASFGRHAFYHEALVSVLPLVDTQRYPEKLLFWVSIGLCVLAALGANAGLARSRTWGAWLARRENLAKIVVTACVLVVLFGLLLDVPARTWIWKYAGIESRFWNVRLPGRVTHLQGLLIHTVVIAGALIGFLWLAAKWPKPVLAVVLVAAILDVGWVHYRQTPTAPADLIAVLDTPEALQAIERSDAGQAHRIYYDPRAPGKDIHVTDGRISKRLLHRLSEDGDPYTRGFVQLYANLFRRERLAMNSGVALGVRYLNGRYSPLQPAASLRLEDFLLEHAPARLMALSNVRHVITSINPRSPVWQDAGFREFWSDPELNLRILEVDDPLPWASLVPRAEFVGNSPEAALRALSGPRDYRGTVVISGAAHGSSPPDAAHGDARDAVVRVLDASPEHYRVQVFSPYESAHLLVAESHYPGWQATVDGGPAPVLTANFRFMAIPVSRGRHEITLEYRSTYLIRGAAISMVGLLALAFLLRGRRGSRALT